MPSTKDISYALAIFRVALKRHACRGSVGDLTVDRNFGEEAFLGRFTPDDAAIYMHLRAVHRRSV